MLQPQDQGALTVLPIPTGARRLFVDRCFQGRQDTVVALIALSRERRPALSP
jgi:hypothetical protein